MKKKLFALFCICIISVSSFAIPSYAAVFTSTQLTQICADTGFPTTYKSKIENFWYKFIDTSVSGISSTEYFDVSQSMARGEIPGLFEEFLITGRNVQSASGLSFESQILRAIYGEVSNHYNATTIKNEVYGLADMLTNQLIAGEASSYQNALETLDYANPDKTSVYHKGIFLKPINDVCITNTTSAFIAYAAAWREARNLCEEPRYAPRYSSLPTGYIFCTDIMPSISYYPIGGTYFTKTLP